MIAAGRQIVLVSGPPGIGKTTIAADTTVPAGIAVLAIDVRLALAAAPEVTAASGPVGVSAS